MQHLQGLEDPLCIMTIIAESPHPNWSIRVSILYSYVPPIECLVKCTASCNVKFFFFYFQTQTELFLTRNQLCMKLWNLNFYIVIYFFKPIFIFFFTNNQKANVIEIGLQDCSKQGGEVYLMVGCVPSH